MPPTSSALKSPLTDSERAQLQTLARQMRVDSIRATTAAGSGHPTSSMSAADLMAVLLARHLRYDFARPNLPTNDALIFSKGHAAPLLYAIYRAAGAIDDAALMSLRKRGSHLQGHPVPEPDGLPWVHVATGSLGQGLPDAVGVALSLRRLESVDARVWTLLGDSEMAEGSNWEAFEHAFFNGLGNLIAILDMNRLGQRGPTMWEWNGSIYAQRAAAFGWRTLQIDGHDLDQIDDAYRQATESPNVPTFIIARTEKGRGVSFLANQENWHGKPLTSDQAKQALEELGGTSDLVVPPHRPPEGKSPARKQEQPVRPVFTEPVATRQAFGQALKALGDAREDVVALDGEVGNSTYSELFAHAHPRRFFQMYIAEQQMVAAAVGLQTRGWVPFASTFAAFMTRALDFIRMAAISRARLNLCGTHAGCSIGEDGPSQMGLEDLAMMRAISGSTVLYPSDGPSAAALTFAMADLKGIAYLRATREKTPIVYAADEAFPIGGSKTLHRSPHDIACVVGAGVTLHEALDAWAQLQQEGLPVRVVDLYSVKPVDTVTLCEAARETGHLIVVEDHWAEGGLGDAVLAAIAGQGCPMPCFTHLAVRVMPESGRPAELLDAAGISARHIVEAVKTRHAQSL